MRRLEKKVQKSIKKESNKRLLNDERLKKVIDKYNDLKSRGIIQDDRYSLVRNDYLSASIYRLEK